MTAPQKATRTPLPHSGFALVIALSLMAFVLLLLLSITTLTQVELVNTSTNKDQLEARSNALFSAMLALGELQQVAGPDQSVTARAEIFDTTPAYDDSAAEPQEYNQATGVNEPYWVGIWTTKPDELGASLTDITENPAIFKSGLTTDPASKGAKKWLVSSDNLNPLTHTRDVTKDVPLLIVDDSQPNDPRNIYLPKSEIVESGRVSGHYAWWVCDEGMKGSVAIEDSSDPTDAAYSTISQITPRRMAPEFVTSNLAELDLSFLQGVSDLNDELQRIQSHEHFNLILSENGASNINVAAEITKNRHHDLTTTAYGLLTDTRRGGLKKDLSAAFESDTEFDKLLAHNEGELVFGRRTVAGEVPHSPIGSSATISNGTSVELSTDTGGPPWAQLRDFYQLRPDTINGATKSIAPRHQKDDQAGIYPIISHFQQYFHWVLIRDGNQTDSSGQVRPRYRIRMLQFPALVLWNPYNAEISNADYSVFYGNSTDDLFYNWKAAILYKTAATGNNYNKWNASGTDGNGRHLTPFHVNPASGKGHQTERYDFSASFAPGEAKLFIPPAPQQYREPRGDPNGGNLLAEADSSITPGGYIYSDLHEAGDPNNLIYFVPEVADPTELTSIHMGISGQENGKNNLPLALYIEKQGLTLHLRDTATLNAINDTSSTYDGFALSTVPLQSVQGVNHRAAKGVNEWHTDSKSNYFTHFMYEPDAATNQFTGIQDISAWTDRRITEFSPVNDGQVFPSTGTYFHLRMSRNAFEPGYASSETSAGFNPRFPPFANFNPRASRSWLTLPERLSKDTDNNYEKDSWNNPLYYAGYERKSDIQNNTFIGMDVSVSLIGEDSIPIGFSDDIADFPTIHQATLFDIPAGPEYFQSIASLQQAPLMPPQHDYSDVSMNFDSNNKRTMYNTGNIYPAFAIGNSLAPLSIPLDQRSQNDWGPGTSRLKNKMSSVLYDMSYLLNDNLWDNYFFSTWDATALRPLNPRLQTVSTMTSSDFDQSAESLMVKGSFNVNSTSIAAWRTLLSGLSGAEVQLADGSTTKEADRSPIVSILSPLGGDTGDKQINDGETYTGYRALTNAEIDDLAKQIVAQVKKRGPFISMAHFVNRVIEQDWDDSNQTGFRSEKEATNLVDRERAIGALQAAIEASTVNQRYNQTVDGDEFEIKSTDIESRAEFYEPLSGAGSMAYGTPGYITQANLLAKIGSVLSVRSDTFTIRSFGESLSVSGETKAEAWCEMKVQRIADPIDATPANVHNRKFIIVDFRWLADGEI